MTLRGFGWAKKGPFVAMLLDLFSLSIYHGQLVLVGPIRSFVSVSPRSLYSLSPSRRHLVHVFFFLSSLSIQFKEFLFDFDLVAPFLTYKIRLSIHSCMKFTFLLFCFRPFSSQDHHHLFRPSLPLKGFLFHPTSYLSLSIGIPLGLPWNLKEIFFFLCVSWW